MLDAIPVVGGKERYGNYRPNAAARLVEPELQMVRAYWVLPHPLKQSDAYKMAVARAKADSRVVAALGTPIEEGWYLSGKTNVNGGSGDADLSIPVSGPKGKGTIYAVATKSAGEWTYSKLQVKIESTGETIDLGP